MAARRAGLPRRWRLRDWGARWRWWSITITPGGMPASGLGKSDVEHRAAIGGPYQIPYRILVPETVDGLLAPVPASTTHVAFSSIRMEPTWMALGQAAGVAAHLALEYGVQPRGVSTDALQRKLLEQGRVITFFRDIDRGGGGAQAAGAAGDLTRGEVADLLPAGPAGSAVRRGELCRALYRRVTAQEERPGPR